MKEMRLYRTELLPDRWRPEDPRCPTDELAEHIFFAGMTHEDLRQYVTEAPDIEAASHAREYLAQWTPLKMAEALRDAAFKIESQTIRPESEFRN